MKETEGESLDVPWLEEVVAGTQIPEANKVQETPIMGTEELREPDGGGSFRGKEGNGRVYI